MLGEVLNADRKKQNKTGKVFYLWSEAMKHLNVTTCIAIGQGYGKIIMINLFCL